MEEIPGAREPEPMVDPVRFATAARQVETAAMGGFYVLAWKRGEKEPCYQTAGLSHHVAQPQPTRRETGVYVHTRGEFREAYLVTQHGECILVGHSFSRELADSRSFGALLAGGSLVVLTLGLGGAWFIIAAALRPVKNISEAAVKISSGDLSLRINVDETEGELGQLAAVLNGAFSRLESAFARQKQFTADAAHELRTPVSIILTHTQNGLAGECQNPEHHEAFEACQRAAWRMKKLIGALLSLARLDEGRGVAERENVDLPGLVSEGIELLRPLAAERQVTFSTTLVPVKVWGDPGQLGQVVTNLLTNAIQYNRPGGEVRVRLERNEHGVELEVEDTGAGIPSEDLPRIFERFYRADKSRSSVGLGLGLAISNAIVVAHGGEICVVSEPGRGSTFTVRLPAC
jgi:heavy metal sensor kinase